MQASAVTGFDLGPSGWVDGWMDGWPIMTVPDTAAHLRPVVTRGCLKVIYRGEIYPTSRYSIDRYLEVILVVTNVAIPNQFDVTTVHVPIFVNKKLTDGSLSF